MRIRSVETELYQVPRQPGLSSASARIESTSLLVARVQTDEGLEGVGWTYSHGASGRGMKVAIDTLFADRLIGEDPEDIERLWDALWRCVFPNITMAGLTTVALAPVDIALWDLAGKAAGKPLFRLLGAHRESVPAYGSGLDLAYSTEALVDEAESFARRDFWGVKIKVGRDHLGEDLERLQAVRQAIGPHMPLMVDANQKWTVGEAISRARAMQDFNLFWLEEPILAEDHSGYERLSRTAGVALAAGEGEYQFEQFLDLFQRSCLQFVQADVCRVGGVTPWMKIARLAEAYHLPMAPHLVEELSVHLTCGAINGFAVEHLPTLNLNNTGAIANPVLPEGGTFTPLEDPGHGIQFDMDFLSQYVMT
ncbi:MAG: mandelate racemase/muconate lactonizing enzyme family protein [Dehalococcoidia bacterium]